MSPPRSALSPTRLIRDGLDWSGCSGRLAYMIVAVAANVVAVLIPLTQNFSGANTAVFVALTVLVPVWLGHTRRRLRDIGWSGWWMWLSILPVVSLVMIIYLSMKPRDEFHAPGDATYSRLGFAASLVAGAMALSRVFWAPYWIPSDSMQPALIPGDFIAVVPVVEPERGDIIVYRNPVSGQEFIKRVIGLPGDAVPAMEDVANGVDSLLHEPLAGEGDGRPEAPEASERLMIGPDQYLLVNDTHLDAMGEPPTASSLGAEFVASGDLVGRAAVILFSSASDGLLHVWSWRRDRLVRRIE